MMVDSARAPAFPIDEQPEAARKRPTPVNQSANVPVEKLLPTALIAELSSLVRAVSEITPKFRDEVDRQLGITDSYRVSRRRLLNYLRRLHGQHEPESGQTVSVDQRPRGDAWREKIRHHRKRQASVASILDTVFGPLAKCKPELWERRAYLMLVGLVYERLATGEAEIPTDELVAVAKVLAENRRVEARLRETGQSQEPADAPAADKDGRLPDQLGDVVRQLYGTNFQQSAIAHSQSAMDNEA